MTLTERGERHDTEDDDTRRSLDSIQATERRDGDTRISRSDSRDENPATAKSVVLECSTHETSRTFEGSIRVAVMSVMDFIEYHAWGVTVAVLVGVAIAWVYAEGTE